MLLKRSALFFSLLIFILPPLVPFHFPPMGSFWFEWLAGVLVILAWSFAWANPSKVLEMPSALVLWTGWGIVLLLSVFHADYKIISPAYFYGIFWLLGALTLFLVSSLKRHFGLEKLSIWIGYSLLISGVLQATLGLGRYYGLLAKISPWLQPIGVERMPGLLNYPTITGFSLWISIYATVYLFCKNRINWFLAAVCMAPVGVAVIAVGDRASALYGAVLLLFPLLIFIRDRKSRSKIHSDINFRSVLKINSIILFVLLVSIPVYGLLNSSMSSKPRAHAGEKTHFNFTSNYKRSGHFFGIRVTEFEKALYLVKSHFWLGVGPGNYPYQSYRLNQKIKGAVREGTVNTNSHNIFSMVIAEEGVAGVAVLLVGITLLVYWWWTSLLSVESLFLGSVLAAFFAFSNIEFPLWYLNFLVIFMVFVGLVSPDFEMRMDHAWVKPGLAVAMVLVGGAIAINVAHGFFEISYAQRNRTLDSSDYSVLASWTADRLLEPYAMLAMEQYTTPRPTNIKGQLRTADKLISRYPMPKALLDKSILLMFQGKKDMACSHATVAASSYPYIMEEYEAEMEHYSSGNKALLSDLATLKPCLEKGVGQWKTQRED